jgi:hypothetical protein
VAKKNKFEMPEPLGFSESLEQYVSRCGIQKEHCNCGVGENRAKVEKQGYPSLPGYFPCSGHALSCPFGESYAMWKKRGAAIWASVKHTSVQIPDLPYSEDL